MRKDEFRTFAATRLGPKAVSSYICNCRHVEKVIGRDLDASALAEPDVRNIIRRLDAGGTPSKRVNNCGSALRMYAEFSMGTALNTERLHIARAGRGVAKPPQAPLQSSLVRNASVIDLLRMYGDVLDELQERNVLRTGNGPIGDYAERLFATAFGWKLAGNSASGHDAESGDVRYQIKARRLAKPNGSRQLSVIRALEGRPFDVLAAVLFNRRFDVQRAALIPYEIVVTRAKWVAHVNGHRFLLPEAVWGLPGVEDVTLQLQSAADQSPAS